MGQARSNSDNSAYDRDTLELLLLNVVSSNDMVKFDRYHRNHEGYLPLSEQYKTEMRRTLVHIALRHTDCQMLGRLLQLGASTDLQDFMGRTPAHTAVQAKNLTGLRMLIAAKADLNMCDKNKHTPLHTAASTGQIEAMVHLLMAGGWFSEAAIGQRQSPGYLDALQSTFCHEVRTTQRAVREAMVAHCDDRRMLAASLRGLLRELGIETGPAAVAERALRLVLWRSSKLMRVGLMVAFRAARDGRPLELSRRMRQGKEAGGLFATGELKVPEGLEGAGETVGGATCMMAAVAHGHESCVQILINCGWSMSLARTDSRGNTALWWARDPMLRQMLLGQLDADHVLAQWTQCDSTASLVVERGKRLQEYQRAIATKGTTGPRLRRELEVARWMTSKAQDVLRKAEAAEQFTASCIEVQYSEVQDAYSKQDEVGVLVAKEREELFQKMYEAQHSSSRILAALRDAAVRLDEEAEELRKAGAVEDEAEVREQLGRVRSGIEAVGGMVQARAAEGGVEGGAAGGGGGGGAASGAGADIHGNTQLFVAAALDRARAELNRPRSGRVGELAVATASSLRQAMNGDTGAFKAVMDRIYRYRDAIKSQAKELVEITEGAGKIKPEDVAKDMEELAAKCAELAAAARSFPGAHGPR